MGFMNYNIWIRQIAEPKHIKNVAKTILALNGLFAKGIAEWLHLIYGHYSITINEFSPSIKGSIFFWSFSKSY